MYHFRKDKNEKFNRGKYTKNLMLFAIPIIVSGVIGNAYNLIDTIIVGKYIGEYGLAALGSTSPFITIISSVIWGLGTGIATYIGSIMGSGDYRKMVNEIKANMFLVPCVAIVISTLAILLHKPIFAILSVGEDLYADAFLYYAIYLSDFIFMTFNACSVYVFSAMGNTSYPMIMSAISGVGNVIGNILLIMVFDMGIAGYSVCTQIYNINTAIFYNSSKSINHFCAQCVGGKKPDLVQKGFNIGLRQSVLLTIPIMLCLIIFSDQIVNLFFSDASAESIGYVKTYIYMCILFVLCQVMNNLFHNFFRGVLMPQIGLFTTFVYSVVRIIATYSLVPFFHMNGVFFGLIISWVAEMLVCLYIYYGNKWKSEWYLNLERECKYAK